MQFIIRSSAEAPLEVTLSFHPSGHKINSLVLAYCMHVVISVTIKVVQMTKIVQMTKVFQMTKKVQMTMTNSKLVICR